MYLGGFAEYLALAGLELKKGLLCLDSCGRKMPTLGVKRTGIQANLER